MSDTKDTVKKEAAKESKPGFFSRIGKFFREIRSELKKISWPTFAEVVKNTIITLVVCAILGALIGLFDWGISSLRDWAILQAQNSDDASIAESGDEILDKVEEDLASVLSDSNS